MIFHMVPAAVWQQQLSDQPYSGDTLATEGFIHCTGEADRLLIVANTWYASRPGAWLILCIDEQLVAADVRWEENHGHVFPHIYGPLNLDAIVDIVAFPRQADGIFQLPVQGRFPFS